jgi:hypothetical protein
VLKVPEITVYDQWVARYRTNPPTAYPATQPQPPAPELCKWCAGVTGYFTACTCSEKCEREKCPATPFDLYDYALIPVPRFIQPDAPGGAA